MGLLLSGRGRLLNLVLSPNCLSLVRSVSVARPRIISHNLRCAPRSPVLTLRHKEDLTGLNVAPSHHHLVAPETLGPVTAEEARLLEKLDFARLPRHIAVIMDGNGRWAQKRHLPRVAGHRAGTQSARMAIETCARLHVEALTLYAFSVKTGAAQRPKSNS